MYAVTYLLIIQLYCSSFRILNSKAGYSEWFGSHDTMRREFKLLVYIFNRIVIDLATIVFEIVS